MISEKGDRNYYQVSSCIGSQLRLLRKVAVFILVGEITHIKTFRQLFVISHDDTFEKVTENIILVEREN
jgi:hypothetical protein